MSKQLSWCQLTCPWGRPLILRRMVRVAPLRVPCWISHSCFLHLTSPHHRAAMQHLCSVTHCRQHATVATVFQYTWAPGPVQQDQDQHQYSAVIEAVHPISCGPVPSTEVQDMVKHDQKATTALPETCQARCRYTSSNPPTTSALPTSQI